MVAEEKASFLGIRNRGGADKRLCVVKNNAISLQVKYVLLNGWLKCKFTV